MTDATDLIVRGNIVDIYLADVPTEDSTYEMIWAHVAVTDVLKGTPQTRTDGVIDVALALSGSWEWARLNVPREEQLLFLMNEADYRAREDQRPVDPEGEKFMYWRPNDQAVLRNIDGTAMVIAPQEMAAERGPDRFPLELNGQPFDEVLIRVEALTTLITDGSVR